MSSILKGFYEAFIYREGKSYLFSLDPLAKIVTVVVQIISIFIGTLPILILLLVVSLIEGTINKLERQIFHGIKGVIFPLLIAFSIITLFEGVFRGFRVIIMMINFIIIISSFSETTRPMSIVRALEKCKLPIKISYGITLAIKLIPEIASDALDSILSFTLRGEFKSKVSLDGISKILAALSASAITKSKYLGEALAIKGFTSPSRKSIYTPQIGWREIIRGMIYAGILTLQLSSFFHFLSPFFELTISF